MGLFHGTRTTALWFAILAMTFAASCKSSGGGLLGPVDETAEAAKLIEAANQDLHKIRVLYKANEGKRQELKAALEANNEVEVKRISADVVQLINEGTNDGNSALDKIREAQDMQINSDFAEYLRLKEEAIKKQLEAFEQYRQAARSLRDNYDPKNAQSRETVKTDFEQRSERYRELMEKARDHSSEANELYKESVRKQKN